MSLIEECQSNLGNEVLQQTVSDLIVEKRADVNTYKSQLVVSKNSLHLLILFLTGLGVARALDSQVRKSSQRYRIFLY